MKYIVSYTKPHNHYIDIEFIAERIAQDELLIQLPAWRPGRYELGNFAKNVQRWEAFDEQSTPLVFQKITKDCWKVQTKGVSTVHIKYNYYAADLNAGSTFLDTTQFYMNPVNCCVYIPERINETCELTLQLPAEYIVAIGMQPHAEKHNTFIASDFHELADSPFIASATLKHHQLICGEVPFNLWFQGECKPDWEKLSTDFRKFINEQLLMMKRFPAKQYHFLFQILPNKMYHGVEHTTSTVIALGPGYNLMKGTLYEDLLGVSCHELFHAWNIKTIRPLEMQPYDYTKENYSKLGYVCEGVTTYYGDFLLYRAQVFNQEQFFTTFNERVQKHIDNFGRYHLSVANSSFDTWLDGYVPGVPNRKTSIYDEGNILAFATDIFIRKNTANKHSLDDVMLHLYNEFALKNKGYSEADYKGIVEHYANASFDTIFNNYIHKAADLKTLLSDALQYIGCELVLSPTQKFHEHGLGIKTTDIAGACRVTAIYPNSTADTAGISLNDEIITVNGMQIKADGSGTNFSEWCTYFKNETLVLTMMQSNVLKKVELQASPTEYYKTASIKKSEKVSDEQKNNFEVWSKNKY